MDIGTLVRRHEGHTDERREIIDVTPRIKTFKVGTKYGIELGNHYHQQTTETFYVLFGSLYVALQDLASGDIQETTLIPYQSLKVPPNTAHTFLPAPMTEFLALLDRDFDPKDIYSHNVRMSR